MIKLPHTVFGLILLVGTMSTAHAQIFRCTDSAGKQVFSDKACDGFKREALDMRYRGISAPTPTRSGVPGPLAAPVGALGIPPVLAPTVQPPALPLSHKVPEIPLSDRLANLCVDVYRGHLAYPRGVRIVGSSLEKSLSEYLITVQVKTISNPATPARIDPIVIDEKFICVTDGASGLNARSTDMYVKRHRDGQRL